MCLVVILSHSIAFGFFFKPLTPLRAKIAADMDQLDPYPFCGHGVLMGNYRNHLDPWNMKTKKS
jgi:hypothetical protein